MRGFPSIKKDGIKGESQQQVYGAGRMEGSVLPALFLFGSMKVNYLC